MNKEMRRLNRKLQSKVNELLEAEMRKAKSTLDEYGIHVKLTDEEIECWKEVSHELFTNDKNYIWFLLEAVSTLCVIHLDEHKERKEKLI